MFTDIHTYRRTDTAHAQRVNKLLLINCNWYILVKSHCFHNDNYATILRDVLPKTVTTVSGTEYNIVQGRIYIDHN